MATKEQLIAFAKEAEANGDYETANKIADMLLAIPKPTTMDKVGGAAEVGANLISGMIAEPIAGIAGLGGATFGGLYRAMGNEQKGNIVSRLGLFYSLPLHLDNLRARQFQ